MTLLAILADAGPLIALIDKADQEPIENASPSSAR
jgi:hypothetical protein